jgi:hypothetical protein
VVELSVIGYNLDNAKTMAKILEASGYRVNIALKRDKYSHRNDTYLQIYDYKNISEFEETYIIETIMDSGGEVIKEFKRSQNKEFG